MRTIRQVQTPSDPQNTSEVWKILRSALGEARANDIIVFSVMVGAAWVVLSVLEKIGDVVKALSGEDTVPSADSGEIMLAVGAVLIFAVASGWLMTWRTHQKEMNGIKAELAEIKRLIETHSHEGEAETTKREKSTHGQIHTDDQRIA